MMKINIVLTRASPIMETLTGFMIAGFIYFAGALIHSKSYSNILIVSSDRGTRGRNFNEPESSALLGDAAAAIIIAPSKNSQIISYKMETWPEGSSYTQVKGGGTYRHPDNPQTLNQDNYFTMQGPKVYKMARKSVYEMIQNILQEHNLTPNDIDLVIPHQASGTAVKLILNLEVFQNIK